MWGDGERRGCDIGCRPRRHPPFCYPPKWSHIALPISFFGDLPTKTHRPPPGVVPAEHSGVYVADVQMLAPGGELPRVGDQLFRINGVDAHSWSVRQVASALSKARDHVELEVAMHVDAMRRLQRIAADEEEIGERYTLVSIVIAVAVAVTLPPWNSRCRVFRA